MPYLLDRAPFPDAPAEILVRGETVRLRANQIIAWVSLTLNRVGSPNPLAVPFPIILDTGFSHTLAIRERHLIEWGGLRGDTLPLLGAIRERGVRALLRAANIWVHPNQPGTRELAGDREPHLVSAQRGIAVYPTDDFPRLPILGLRAIAENDLLLTVNGRHREATLRTSFRWWPF